MRGRLATGDEWWRARPQGAAVDALRVLAARGVRAFGDGFVALLLPIYLVERGFDALAIGTIVTGTLIGTALMTLWVGWIANRHSRRLLLLAAAALMIATGVGFAATAGFWPLLLIAVVGTMNPTSGDASIFVPLEQTVLTETIEPRRRTALFARYSCWRVSGRCSPAATRISRPRRRPNPQAAFRRRWQGANDGNRGYGRAGVPTLPQGARPI
jgi:MFS family permease